MPAIGEVVLDTSVAVAHLRGIKGVTSRFESFKTLYLPMVALGELFCGVRMSARVEENKAGIKAWISLVTLLPLTEETADRYSEIKIALAKAGTPIPENDIWIAAHAMERGIPLAARDQHFDRISGLVVLDWR